MPTDPYVPTPLDEQPRQTQNFAAGVSMPPARAWRADRPGDDVAEPPRGALTGSPGPNVGFALTLANRSRDRFRLESGEHLDDVVAVVAEVAMKRAATFGRAPTMLDVDVAAVLLGYVGAVTDDVGSWRPGVVRGARHDYVVRRRIANAVSRSALLSTPAEIPDHLVRTRASVASVASGEVTAITDDPAPTGPR